MLIKKNITFIIGTRPEVIRVAPIVKYLYKIGDSVNCTLIHTGQHYSANMREELISDLNIEVKMHLLELQNRVPYSQLGEMIDKLGNLLNLQRPDIVCVWGDTNSSLAGALAANKLQIPLCHIESGCRSYDRRMPEEHNRIMIDVISDILMPLSFHDQNNLIREKIKGVISWVGDPLFDVFKEEVSNLDEKYEIKSDKPYCLVTIHRAENVDKKETLENIFKTLASIENYDVVFPLHPRTKKMAEEFGLLEILESRENIKLKDPFSYHELLGYLISSRFVITDSGGVQKEAYFAGKPCITMRKSTEWVDTERLGVNIVLDPVQKELQSKTVDTINNLNSIAGKFAEIKEYPYGQGNSSSVISNILMEFVNK